MSLHLLTADACSSWIVLTGFLSRCMQYWLENHWPHKHLFKHQINNGWQSLSLSMPLTIFLIQRFWVIIMIGC